MRKFVCTLLLIFSVSLTYAQHQLGKVVSIHLENQALATVLDQLSKTGDFQFSYKSDILLQEKKVSINEQNKTVKYILDKLLQGSYHYTERGKYIIIHEGGEKFFTISGYIQDGRTGARIGNVSVYEDQILASTLSNAQGYFKLPIKNKHRLKTISIVVSKQDYSEFSIDLNAGYDQELVLPILPSQEIQLKDIVVVKEKEDQSWAGRFLISSKQRIQNINVGKFIAQRPIQTSLLPGIGTHGMLGANVVNKFSLNMLGGYTAGVNGFELGSLFNINKGSVSGVQIAGLFNSINGNMNGGQLGGLYNYSTGNVTGVQLAGLTNRVKGNVSAAQLGGISNNISGHFSGVQIAGIVNKNKDSTRGVQFAGLANWNDSLSKGVQIAGLQNMVETEMKGVQFSGLLNYARKMKGLQIGVINMADTMDGIGFGLASYYKNGYHKIVLSCDELLQMNLGYLSGTKRLYTFVGMGINLDPNNKAYSLSYGIGRQFAIGKRFALNAQVDWQGYYIGTWDYVPLSFKAQSSLIYKFKEKLEFYAGPSYTFTETRSTTPGAGYMNWLHSDRLHYTAIGNRVTAWLGWQVGIRIF